MMYKVVPDNNDCLFYRVEAEKRQTQFSEEERDRSIIGSNHTTKTQTQKSTGREEDEGEEEEEKKKKEKR
jgi:hypothetical protein